MQLVREKALSILAEHLLPATSTEISRSILSFLAAEDNLFDLLPAHFVNTDDVGGLTISHEQIFDLCIAGKLLYAQCRWIDSIIDDYDHVKKQSHLHSINEAITECALSLFLGAFNGRSSQLFLRSLSALYARHSLSATLDARSRGRLDNTMTVEDYIAQARARAAPVRAAVEAALLLANAPESILERVQTSLEYFAVGLQFYDDTIDLEEDFREERPSWLVCETLRYMEKQYPRKPEGYSLADLFYATAQLEGLISTNLLRAEHFFEASRGLVEPDFPLWIERCDVLLSKTSTLRTDYQNLISSYSSSKLHE